ncbi:MAG: methyl-accepting chemotaxis protein, partial [Kiritimatiellae bacterium]|nr:methyl-accepting chemotaxis protein [Kiritimatiellia bacterium]
MGIKQKFFALSGVVGLLLAIVSIIGYYTASTNLNASIEGEINYTVRAEAEELEGWLREKKASATYAASLMTGFNGNMAKIKSIDSLSSVADDQEILDLNIGMEDGYFASLKTGDGTGRLDPRTRPWYTDTKKAGKAIFTEAYVDKNTNKLVVSAVAPFKVNGAFGGALCTDVGLDVVTEQAKKIKYQKEGIGIIIEPTGKILASGGDHQQMSDFKSIPDIGARFDQMVQNKKGFFTYESKDGTNVFAYRTIPSTGWIIGLAVPYDFVYASLIRMRYTYTIAVVAGLILVTFLCLQFASRITTPIIELEKDAKEMAAGNLRMPPIPVESSDEIGSLTGAFNEMQKNLKSLIGQMSSTSEQVASSSEELTAGAHQAAQAATNVAETVVEVAGGMDKQLTNIDQAKQNVDAAFIDIQNMTEQAKEAAQDSERTKEAAEHGSTLMQDAMHRMEQIESSVMSSAEVVKKLGENSKQIGQIVESISAIADQTNLLALNAAIEAARAGEAGR